MYHCPFLPMFNGFRIDVHYRPKACFSTISDEIYLFRRSNKDDSPRAAPSFFSGGTKQARKEHSSLTAEPNRVIRCHFINTV